VQGLAAISAQHGWAMALTGACIVMTGLSVLAFIISQLHKIVEMLEKKAKKPEKPIPRKAVEKTETVRVEENILDDLATAAKICAPLTADLGETFELSKLYQVFEKENLPHPHITIRALREAGYLVPAGEGSFSWTNN
jgi:Na+-transporting methylmalonyl-CoA/oxaloacetate decarboxylase gamma subunit